MSAAVAHVEIRPICGKRSRVREACDRILAVDAEIERLSEQRLTIDDEIRTQAQNDKLLNRLLAAERHLVRLGPPRSLPEAAAMAEAAFVMGIDRVGGRVDIYGDQTVQVIATLLEWLIGGWGGPEANNHRRRTGA